MERLFGYARSDLIGKDCSILSKLLSLESEDLCKEKFDELLNQTPITPLKLQIQKKSRELTWVNAYFSSIEIAGKIYYQIIMQDIYEGVIKEQKLKDSEYKYRLITENANDMISVLDNKYKYIYINEETYLKFLGYSKKDLIGKSAWKFIYHEDINKYLKDISGKGDVDENKAELRVKHKDGNWIWIQVNIRRFKDEIRKKNRYLIVSREITKQIQAEDELKESEMKFRTLFNSSTSGIAYHKIVYDENGNPINYIITDVNPQFENILHIEKKDAINKIATNTYKVDKAPYLEVYSKVAESKESLSFETYYAPMNKHFKISVIPSKDGEFITVFEDISEQKMSSLKLKESEEKYRQLIENAQEGIWAIDKNAQTTFVNPKMAEILGYSVNEMIGKPIFYFMNDRGVKIAENNIERRKQGIQEHYDFEFLRKDGKRVFTRLEDSPMFDENDKYIGSLA
jgi:PAS domain S-box-containing protein